MPTPITMPEAGESVVSGVLSAWVKPEGSAVKRDEPVAEIETDKITVEVLAPADGVLKHGAAEGDDIEIGAEIGSVDESATPSAAPAAPAEAAAPAAAAVATQAPPAPPPAAPAPPANGTAAPAAANGSASGGVTSATPLAKKLAEDYGIALSSVTGTGPAGRIREHDVLAVLQGGGPAPAEASAAPAPATAREISVERMSPMRQKIASRLVEAQQTAAMLTTFNEVDMSGVMALRKKHKEAFAEKHEINLGFMSFFVKAVCGALKAFPDVNSQIVADDQGKPAVQSHGYCDVAIAVASPKGLVVPVIRNAESLSFAEIESTIKDFGVRAKGGKLDLSEMQGGTFTITNGGVFGSLLSTPILNPPQSGILGMHGIKNRAIENPDKPGEIVLRPMMYLALSYDHRIVDGAGAVRFLVHIKDAIEDPARLMLEL